MPEAIVTRRFVAEGKIYQEMLNAGNTSGANLIVMGSHHSTLADYPLCPNAANVVRRADCSVLVVRE